MEGHWPTLAFLRGTVELYYYSTELSHLFVSCEKLSSSQTMLTPRTQYDSTCISTVSGYPKYIQSAKSAFSVPLSVTRAAFIKGCANFQLGRED
jgi:hypothetical protein